MCLIDNGAGELANISPTFAALRLLSLFPKATTTTTTTTTTTLSYHPSSENATCRPRKRTPWAHSAASRQALRTTSHAVMNIDHFCAEVAGKSTHKCQYCVAARKGTALGGCVEIEIQSVEIRTAWDRFVEARAAARLDRVDQEVYKQFLIAGDDLRNAVGEVKRQFSGYKGKQYVEKKKRSRGESATNLQPVVVEDDNDGNESNGNNDESDSDGGENDAEENDGWENDGDGEGNDGNDDDDVDDDNADDGENGGTRGESA
ncbi:hypothetical protein F4777DRAFT_583991 [Nemania sp. FL0916]|nr:hypothetical protein F4777DRAFT_583991 [Nemania sp. FL0916]